MLVLWGRLKKHGKSTNDFLYNENFRYKESWAILPVLVRYPEQNINWGKMWPEMGAKNHEPSITIFSESFLRFLKKYWKKIFH